MASLASEIDQKIQETKTKIQLERKLLDGTRAMKNATTNQDVLRRLDAKIRDSEASLIYFEETLQSLHAKKRGPDSADARGPGAGGSPSTPRGWGGEQNRSLPLPPDDGAPIEAAPKRNYTNLDLLKADTPHTNARITKMIHLLETKLRTEQQYKRGTEKMIQLYTAEGDKKSRVEAEGKRFESENKIQLLQQALKRYKSLYIMDDEEDGEFEETHVGKLMISLTGAKHLEHPTLQAGARRASKNPAYETTVVIRIEGTPRAQSHPSRTDRWNEDFTIDVDKANEIEIALYDKAVGSAATQPSTPIGLLWMRISDIAEAQRRQKVDMEVGQGGWVTAGAMGGGSVGQGRAVQALGAPIGGGAPSQEGISGVFTVEPEGAIAMTVSFVKENVRKRPFDGAPGGLGRQGAVRMRKGEVHEMNGHQFVQRQFYQLMQCAYCSEFFVNAGYQCEDCRYCCHKKCYPKVVTKCISKSNVDDDPDDAKINHRIPHRFETMTNLSTNWCCHCGYMLPLGRKNFKKCTECDLTCHAACAHLVPYFCGMTMANASALINSMRDIRSHQQHRPRPPTHQTQPSFSHQPSGSQSGITYEPEKQPTSPTTQIEQGMSGMNLGRPQDDYGPGPAQPPKSSPYPPSNQPLYGSGVAQVPLPGPPGPAKRTSGPGYDPYGTPPNVHAQPAQRPNNLPPPAQAQQQRPDPYATQQYQQPPPQHNAPPQQQVAPPKKRSIGLNDFNFLAVLGKGNFGKVMLAEEKKTNSLYAIKVLKKEFVIDHDEVESTRSEKRVFLAAARERHPFLLGLHSCFQTETRIYFVMEYVSGGDLMLHIQRKQFSLRQAKFYACEVLLALEYFHSQGIIYRDLKLDNILLTLDGHVKVADYGLCKENMEYGQTTSTFCGTPEFMAPEILLEQRYGRAVDWWAFGVLTYEMLLGQSPFRGDDEDEIFDAILEDEPLYPITMPRDAVSILQRLLTRDPSKRLGSGPTDAEEIKAHPFFNTVNFDDVLNKRIPPPYYPTISSAHDTSNFDTEFTREQPTLTPVHGQLSAADQAQFQGFSWQVEYYIRVGHKLTTLHK
ncbi:protein kinase C [Rhizoctonia solani]|uniref:protein kinase C n=1 Tax=Rhizoctonia solani TaxID=456999 RepID=A0A8H8NUF9_9AGAM|nr:protein kinase C [Rhizoctonia solani]QRW20251.1 protein kinase C [Rhizoctonia solani]